MGARKEFIFLQRCCGEVQEKKKVCRDKELFTRWRGRRWEVNQNHRTGKKKKRNLCEDSERWKSVLGWDYPSFAEVCKGIVRVLWKLLSLWLNYELIKSSNSFVPVISPFLDVSVCKIIQAFAMSFPIFILSFIPVSILTVFDRFPTKLTIFKLSFIFISVFGENSHTIFMPIFELALICFSIVPPIQAKTVFFTIF